MKNLTFTISILLVLSLSPYGQQKVKNLIKDFFNEVYDDNSSPEETTSRYVLYGDTTFFIESL